MTHRSVPYLFSTPAAALCIGLLGGPLVFLIQVCFQRGESGHGVRAAGGWTTANLAAVTDAYGLSLAAFSLCFGVAVATIGVGLAYPLALFIRKLSLRGRMLALGMVLLPKLTSILVILFGLQQILSAAGPLSWLLVTLGVVAEPVTLSHTLFAALLGEVYLILPYAVLILFVQLLRIEPALEAAAHGLGATRWQTFRLITLPLSLPGVLLAGQLALIWGMGAFLGPMLLGSPEQATLSVEIHRQAFEYSRWPRAAANAVVLLIGTGAMLGLFALLTHRLRDTT